MNNVKCNFSCVMNDIKEEDGEPAILCSIKLKIYETLLHDKWGYWKCDGEDCVFQRLLKAKEDVGDM